MRKELVKHRDILQAETEAYGRPSFYALWHALRDLWEFPDYLDSISAPELSITDRNELAVICRQIIAVLIDEKVLNEALTGKREQLSFLDPGTVRAMTEKEIQAHFQFLAAEVLAAMAPIQTSQVNQDLRPGVQTALERISASIRDWQPSATKADPSFWFNALAALESLTPRSRVENDRADAKAVLLSKIAIFQEFLKLIPLEKKAPEPVAEGFTPQRQATLFDLDPRNLFLARGWHRKEPIIRIKDFPLRRCSNAEILMNRLRSISPLNMSVRSSGWSASHLLCRCLTKERGLKKQMLLLKKCSSWKSCARQIPNILNGSSWWLMTVRREY